jgi:hypothetical protein
VSPVSPEARLVLLLARGTLAGEAAGPATTLLAGSLSWPEVLRLVRQHGVGPLFARNLARLGHGGVPAEARSALAAGQRLDAARNALLIRGLVQALALLAEAGIPAIPLKGPALALSLHGDATLRECSDLDVLIPREAVAPAFALLLARGYEHGEEARVAPSEVEALLESNMEYGFTGGAGGLAHLVELHWDIAWRWRGDDAAMRDLWAEARPAEYWGAAGLGLSPEWRLLYLCVHAARHGWGALKWLVDIHEVCTAGGLDWGRVGEKARRLGWQGVLDITLSACASLLGTRVPRDLASGALPRWVRLFPAPPPAGAGGLRDALLPALFLCGIPGKLGYLARLFFLPTLGEYRLLRIPSPIRLAYFPLRLVRLGGRWGWPVLRAGLPRLPRRRQRMASTGHGAGGSPRP